MFETVKWERVGDSYVFDSYLSDRTYRTRIPKWHIYVRENARFRFHGRLRSEKPGRSKNRQACTPTTGDTCAASTSFHFECHLC